MKKIISLSLCLILLFNIGATVFAEKGDPLNEHLEYTDLIREFFKKVEESKQNPEYPALWKKEPKFLFWADDYRTVRAYNMPLLISQRDRDDSFLSATAGALIKSRQAAAHSEVIARMIGKPVVKIFIKLLVKELTGSSEIVTVADFLGTDEQTAIDSFISAAGMTFLSQASMGLSLVSAFTNVLHAFPSLTPKGRLAVVVLTACLSLYAENTAVNYQSAENNAIVLNSVFQKILNRPQDVMDSNLLVTAVDDRNNFFGTLSRNDGAWCDFVYIGGLRCAPRARDYQGGQLVNTYIDIYHRIMQDESLDLRALDDYIHGRLVPERPLHIVRANPREEEHADHYIFAPIAETLEVPDCSDSADIPTCIETP